MDTDVRTFGTIQLYELLLHPLNTNKIIC
jgi:hypothetical protein